MKLNIYGEVLENASLKNLNTYGIDTSCDYLVYPKGVNELKDLLKYLNREKKSYFILGGGSNVILPDEHFNGVVINLKNLNNVVINETEVTSLSGINLSVLVNTLVNSSLSGLESLANIPGTLGGAIYGNAGVKDVCIMDAVKEVTVIRNNELITLNKEDIKYSYRYTEFKDNRDIIISCKLELTFGDSNKMKELIKENRSKRISSQPLKYKNAGSVFKNPEGAFAGALIEKCGLKGYNVGDAYVSSLHANFIVNMGSAKSSDIKTLISIIKETVKEETGYELELEQIIVKW